MKKSSKIIFSAFSLLILDILLTIYYINNYYNLVTEGNTLIYVDSGYWVLLINIIYLSIIIVLAKYLDKYRTIVLDARNSFDYLKKLYKSEHSNFIFASIAFALIYATLFSRTIVVIEWLLFGIYKGRFFSTKYYLLRRAMPFARFDIVFGILIFIILIPFWYKLEYRKVQKDK